MLLLRLELTEQSMWVVAHLHLIQSFMQSIPMVLSHGPIRQRIRLPALRSLIVTVEFILALMMVRCVF